MGKIILDLCGGTGSWSKPYAKRDGYTVYVITLPKYDLFESSIKGDFIVFPDNEGLILRVKISDVYGILAAPTCTMFSLARTTAKKPRDFYDGMKLVRKCLEIVWECRSHPLSTLKFWALENPVGYLRQFLGRPPLTFNPNDYGDSYTKKTDVWGYFNEPKKRPRKLTEEELLRCRINNRELPSLPDDYILPEGWNSTAAKRSMTSQYFAEAFYRANK